jgi:hypothetical protein
VATKIKLVYAGDEPGHEHIVEIWTDGRLEIVPNAPDVPMPYQEQQADG